MWGWGNFVFSGQRPWPRACVRHHATRSLWPSGEPILGCGPSHAPPAAVPVALCAGVRTAVSGVTVRVHCFPDPTRSDNPRQLATNP